MIVTTTERPDARTRERALALAHEWGAAYVPRLRHTIAKLCRMHGAAEAAVVGPKEIKLVPLEGAPFFFHPSMGLVRLKRVLAGETDSLVAASEAAPGDAVLDCTAGFCSDALVFSHAVGETGKVVALEASPVLHGIVREGLAAYETGLPEVDRAMRAIETVRTDYESYLSRLGDNSFDIVYFDPMFDHPVEASAALSPLRAQARMGPVTPESVQEAVRVARKIVVLKDRRGSGQFARLGFALARKSYSSVAYGVIKIE